VRGVIFAYRSDYGLLLTVAGHNHSINGKKQYKDRT